MTAEALRAGFEVDPATRHAQRRAADPRASAWVSANAGAGKTKVLTDRVVRLLLAGAAPARILCLTFTKAAAANMAIRVTERLGRWVTLPEAELARELEELEGSSPDAAARAAARRLFARAVETPGGLRIETLHAFCERLLHMAPFEANVPARFTVLDEDGAAALAARAFAGVLADAAGDDHPALAEALRVAAAEAAGPTLREAVFAALRQRAVLDAPDEALDALRRALGLAPGETAAAIEARLLTAMPADLAGLAVELGKGGKRDAGLAASLGAAAEATGPARLAHLRAVFLTEKGTPRAEGGLASKAVPEAAKLALVEAARTFAAASERLRAAATLERSTALFALAAEVDRRVAAQKARLGALDFDDLVHRTLAMLARVDAGWLLYKLDRGIDHVLVDEAQDTNPEQWEILRRITADFAAGEGARADAARTRFAVGDPKQSIYSFQGAAPREFAETRARWRRETGDARLRFEDVSLRLSFRSAGAVLSAVDATFALPDHYRGLDFDDAVGTVHASARPRAPGHVELWPVQAPEEAPPLDPFDPPDAPSEAGAPSLIVARRVAGAIRAWTTEGDGDGRVWRAGDVLVLVRKRGPAFEAVIRALRAAGVPVAGQDRLDVAAHIAVLDLVAAGRAALLPDDDLTLAAALKSPLAGLDDDDLVRIAARRDEAESLAAALRRHAPAGDPAAIRGAAALAHWAALARAHGPFGFYLHLLGPGGGRARLVARLGEEAGDAVDVFLCAARDAETGEKAGACAPSLNAFLARYEPRGGEVPGHTVRRDLESGRDEVRVMTVHGAKGLEAPLVVLIDGCTIQGREDPLLPIGEGAPAWASAGQDCPASRAARAARRALGREEHNRLLYVAMTRAGDRLVIAPFRVGDETPAEAWCEMVRRGLVARAGGLVEAEMPYGPVSLWREGAAVPGPALAPIPARAPVAPPDWLHRPAEPEIAAPPCVRPSHALAAAGAPAERPARVAEPEGRRRGILVHALLEHLPDLPAGRRRAAAESYLAARAPAMPRAARSGIADDALAVIEDPVTAPLFAPGSRAEVALAGEIDVAGTVRAVLGRVDRLAIEGADGAVQFADFRTGAPVAATEHLVQLALYRRLLLAIYPDRPVHAYLVWTAGPLVREVSAAAMEAALGALLAPSAAPSTAG